MRRSPRTAAGSPPSCRRRRAGCGRSTAPPSPCTARTPRAEPAAADAAVTRERGVVCAVLIADCLPVLFADRAARPSASRTPAGAGSPPACSSRRSRRSRRSAQTPTTSSPGSVRRSARPRSKSAPTSATAFCAIDAGADAHFAPRRARQVARRPPRARAAASRGVRRARGRAAASARRATRRASSRGAATARRSHGGARVARAVSPVVLTYNPARPSPRAP